MGIIVHMTNIDFGNTNNNNVSIFLSQPELPVDIL